MSDKQTLFIVELHGGSYDDAYISNLAASFDRSKCERFIEEKEKEDALLVQMLEQKKEWELAYDESHQFPEAVDEFEVTEEESLLRDQYYEMKDAACKEFVQSLPFDDTIKSRSHYWLSDVKDWSYRIEEMTNIL